MTAAKPAPMAAFCFASGIIDPQHHQQCPGGEPIDRGREARTDETGDGIPSDRRQRADDGHDRPSEDDRARLLARRFHVGGRTDRLRQIRNEDRNEERDAHSFTAGKPDPQHCLFWYPVQQGADPIVDRRQARLL